MSLYHMWVAGVRATRGGDLSRHAPAVRADAGVPAVPAAPGRRRARARRRRSLAAARLGRGAAHLRQLPGLHQPHHLHRRADAVGQVLRHRGGARRARGHAAGDRLGVAADRDRLSRLCSAVHAGQVSGAAGAAVLLHRRHLRLDARRVGLLRDAVRAVRRLHGAQRHRPAVHGLRDGAHRPLRPAVRARWRWSARRCSAPSRAARWPT